MHVLAEMNITVILIYIYNYHKVELTLKVGEMWRKGELTVGCHSPPDQPAREKDLTVVKPGREKKRGKGVSLVILSLFENFLKQLYLIFLISSFMLRINVNKQYKNGNPPLISVLLFMVLKDCEIVFTGYSKKRVAMCIMFLDCLSVSLSVNGQFKHVFVLLLSLQLL